MYSTYNFLKTFIVICLSSWKIREIILFTVISRIFRGFFAKYTMSTPSDQSNFSVKNDKNFRRSNYGTTYNSPVRYHKKKIDPKIEINFHLKTFLSYTVPLLFLSQTALWYYLNCSSRTFFNKYSTILQSCQLWQFFVTKKWKNYFFKFPKFTA